MTRGDITFYLGTLASVIALFLVFWRATAGAVLKRMEDDAVTKLDLANKLSELKDFLRTEFITRKEHDLIWAQMEKRSKPRGRE